MTFELQRDEKQIVRHALETYLGDLREEPEKGDRPARRPLSRRKSKMGSKWACHADPMIGL